MSVGAITTITAAATRIVSRKGSRGSSGTSGGSALAWDFYETVPEVGTYADWVAGGMSGATLFAGRRGPDGSVIDAPDGSRASELVSSIAGGPDGQSVLLGEFGTQLAVAGEAWLVIVPDPDSEDYAGDRWVVLSTEEVSVQRGKIRATVSGEELEIPEYDPEAGQDADVPVAIRVWKPSPRRHEQATSPVIRSLVILEELRLLNAAVAAIARSRITGRGLLLIPAGARFPTQPGQDGAEDSLLDTMIEVFSTAIREPESAAATVPIVLEVPGDMIDGIKWIQFSSDFDARALDLRNEAIRRFATGADVPAEVLLGLGDSNHWGAWALTAEAIRMGVEPRLALVCQALTTEWLQPILEAEGEPDAGEWIVWFDTSGLRSSSNKGASAIDAYDKGLINGEAARRELGYTERDAPGSATDTADPLSEDTSEGDTLPVSATQSMPDTMPSGDQSNAVASAAGTVLGGTSATGTVLDSFTAGANEALAAAVDGLLWAAAYRASHKMLNSPLVSRQERGSSRELLASGSVHYRHPVQPEDITRYRLLDGVWDRVPDIAQRYGADADVLRDTLHNYMSGLLVSGQTHQFDHVPRLLAQMRLSR